MASERAAAEAWKPLAAGLTNGRLLLVMDRDALAVVSQKAFASGCEITKVPLGVLRTLLASQGLVVVSAADADRVHTCADEAFGPFPVQSLDVSVTEIERGIFALRMRIHELERGQLSAATPAPAEEAH